MGNEEEGKKIIERLTRMYAKPKEEPPTPKPKQEPATPPKKKDEK